MGGALKVAPSIDHLPIIGLDETVHDLPASEDCPDDPLPSLEMPILPGPEKVVCEEDIIGVRAAVTYENCLRQLVKFVALPVDRCTGILRTGQVCGSAAPFHTNISFKGTAMSVEWVSLDHEYHIRTMVPDRAACCICIYFSFLTFRSAPMDTAYGGGTLNWS